MFRVVARGYSQEFERWTDALNAAKALIPACKGWTQDIRVFLCDDLVWLYCKEYKYPKYIGAGTYDLLAKLFLQEAVATGEQTEEESSPSSDEA